MDYWNPALPDMRPVLTIVDPQRASFLTALNYSKIGYEVVHANYQKVVNEERSQMEMASRSMARNPSYDYENSYHNYDEILTQIKYLAATCKYLFYFILKFKCLPFFPKNQTQTRQST